MTDYYENKTPQLIVTLVQSLAVVTSELLALYQTGITIVSYFGNVIAFLFALTIVRKLLLQ